MVSSQRVPALLFLTSLLALLTAFAFQYIGELAPCELCVWQRWPHIAVAVISAISFLIAGDRILRRRLLYFCAVISTIGFILAVYHVGIEQSIFSVLATCDGNETADTVEELRSQIEATPLARCNEIAWSFAGISLAGYNGLISLAMAVMSISAARSGHKRRMFA